MHIETLLTKTVCVSLLDVAFSALEPTGLDGPVASALTECEAVGDGAWADLDESSCRMSIKCNTLRTRIHNWGT